MWVVLGGILGGLAALLSAVVGVKAYQAKRIVDQGTRELDAIKLSISSLESALARSDIERERLSRSLSSTRDELRQAREEIRTLSDEVRMLRGGVR